MAREATALGVRTRRETSFQQCKSYNKTQKKVKKNRV